MNDTGTMAANDSPGIIWWLGVGPSPGIRSMWKEIGKECGWKHSRAPSVRAVIEDERTTETVLRYKGRVHGVYCASGRGGGGRSGGRGRVWPALECTLSFVLVHTYILCPIPLSFLCPFLFVISRPTALGWRRRSPIMKAGHCGASRECRTGTGFG